MRPGRHGDGAVDQTAVGCHIADRVRAAQRIPAVELLQHVVAAQHVVVAGLGHEESRVAERHGGGQEPVDQRVGLTPLSCQARMPAVEHPGAAHAEVAAQVVHLAQIEVDQPGILGQVVPLILRIVAVGQAGIQPVVVPFRVHRSVPRLLLQQHDLAVRIERGGERAGPGHAAVIVGAAPGGGGGVHVAVRGAEPELVLDDRGELGAVLDRAGRLGRIAARPRRLQLPVRSAADQVGAPILVDRAEVGEVVVRPVHEPERVLHDACVAELPRVTPLAGGGARAERETLAPVAPPGLVVGHHHLGHAIPMTLRPPSGVVLPIARAMGAPHPCPGDGLPGRHRVGDVRQHLLEPG